MNATFDLKESLKLLRLLKTGRGPGTQWLRVTAIEEYLIFEAGQGVVWVPALVLEPGAFSTRRTPFNKVLASFTGSKTLTLQADAGRFRINSFSGQILDYDPYPARPKGFEPIADDSESNPPITNSGDAAAIAKEDRAEQPSEQKPSPTAVEVERSAEFNGLEREAYNEALEAAAQTFEKGGTLEQAIANAIEQMKVVQDAATIEHETAMEDLIRSVFSKGVQPDDEAKLYSAPTKVPKSILHASTAAAQEEPNMTPCDKGNVKSDGELSNPPEATPTPKAKEIGYTPVPKESSQSAPPIERSDSNKTPAVWYTSPMSKISSLASKVTGIAIVPGVVALAAALLLLIQSIVCFGVGSIIWLLSSDRKSNFGGDSDSYWSMCVSVWHFDFGLYCVQLAVGALILCGYAGSVRQVSHIW